MKARAALPLSADLRTGVRNSFAVTCPEITTTWIRERNYLDALLTGARCEFAPEGAGTSW